MTEINVPPRLPPNEGTGESLFVAPGHRSAGASLLAARSFLKAGGRRARLAGPASLAPATWAHAPEVVFQPWPETESPERDAVAPDAVVVGSAPVVDETHVHILHTLAAKIEGPLLIDAEGLTSSGLDVEALSRRKGPTLLTIGMDELASLTGQPLETLAEEKVDVLQHHAWQWEIFLVLDEGHWVGGRVRAHHLLVASPERKLFINPTGDARRLCMRTSGSVGVLHGVVAAMWELGLEFADAVRAGVFVYGLACGAATERQGADGSTAEDTIVALPDAVRRYRSDYQTLAHEYAGMLQEI
jgi:NAD(P)H-hydrate epimerase